MENGDDSEDYKVFQTTFNLHLQNLFLCKTMAVISTSIAVKGRLISNMEKLGKTTFVSKHLAIFAICQTEGCSLKYTLCIHRPNTQYYYQSENRVLYFTGSMLQLQDSQVKAGQRTLMVKVKDSERNEWEPEVQIVALLSFDPGLNHLNQTASLLFIDDLELQHIQGKQHFIYAIQIESLRLKKNQLHLATKKFVL